MAIPGHIIFFLFCLFIHSTKNGTYQMYCTKAILKDYVLDIFNCLFVYLFILSKESDRSIHITLRLYSEIVVVPGHIQLLVSSFILTIMRQI